MDQIKYSFLKVKKDIEFLQQSISNLTLNMEHTQRKISFLEENLQNLTEKIDLITRLIKETVPTHNQNIPTHNQNIPTHNFPLEVQKVQIYPFSTGNEGVPTDRQTDRQTDQHTQKTQNSSITPSFEQSVTLLSSLDSFKKELRHKFKQITDQEFLVFSTIYQLSEQTGYTDYKTISNKLNLTESSIRDYVRKLIKKELPIEKIKLNNKIITLRIKDNFKKVVPLPLLIQIRDI